MTNAWASNGVMCASSNGFLDITFEESQENFQPQFSECHLMPTSTNKCNNQVPLNGLNHSGNFGDIKQCTPRVLCYSVPVTNYSNNYNSLYGSYNHTNYTEPVKPNYEATAPLNGIHLSNLNSNMGHYPQSQMICPSAYGIDHNSSYLEHRNANYPINSKSLNKFNCGGSLISSDLNSYAKYGSQLNSCHVDGLNHAGCKNSSQTDFYQNSFSLLDKHGIPVEQFDDRRELGLMHKMSNSPSNDEHNSSIDSQSSMNNLITHPRTSSRCDSVRSETAESSCSSLSVDSQAEQILASISQNSYAKSCELPSDLLAGSKASHPEAFPMCLGNQLLKNPSSLHQNLKSLVPSKDSCAEMTFPTANNWSNYQDISCVNFNSFSQNTGVVINDFKTSSFSNACMFNHESTCNPVTSNFFPSVNYSYCQDNVNPSHVISVPYGWKRTVFSESVIYTSPSGVHLRTLQDVCHYLLTEGTCKCGLQCPLRVDHTFNFDPKIPAKHSNIGISETAAMGKCRHKHSCVFPTDSNKDLTKSSLKPCPRLNVPVEKDAELADDQSKEHEDKANPSSLIMQENLWQDSFKASIHSTDKSKAAENSIRSEPQYQSLQIDQVDQSFSYTTSDISSPPETESNGLNFPNASPSTSFKDTTPVTVSSDINSSSIKVDSQSSTSHGESANPTSPQIKDKPSNLSTSESYKVYTSAPVSVTTSVISTVISETGKKRKIVRKPKTKFPSLLDRGSPCPNVDVRQLPSEPNRPPLSVSVTSLPATFPVSAPSFLDNPNEYLAQQTAILRHAISPCQSTFSKTECPTTNCLTQSTTCPNTSGAQVKLSTNTRTVMSVKTICLKEVPSKSSSPLSSPVISLPLVMTSRDTINNHKSTTAVSYSKPTAIAKHSDKSSKELSKCQSAVVHPIKKNGVSYGGTLNNSCNSSVASVTSSSVIVVGTTSVSPQTTLASNPVTCSVATTASVVPFIIQPVQTPNSMSNCATSGANNITNGVVSVGANNSSSNINTPVYKGRHIICSVSPILSSVSPSVTTVSSTISTVPSAVTSVTPAMTQVIPTLGVTQVLGQPVQFVNTMTMPNVLIQSGSHNLIPQTLTLDCVNGSLSLPSNVNIQTSPAIQLPQMVIPSSVSSISINDEKLEDRVIQDSKTKKKSRKRKVQNQSIGPLLQMNPQNPAGLSGQVVLPNVVPPQNLTQPMMQALTILPNGKPQMVLNQQPVAQFSSFSSNPVGQLSHQLVASPSQQYFTSSHVNSLSSAVSPLGTNAVGQINLIQPLSLFGNTNSSALIQNLPIQQIVLPSLSLVSPLPDGTLIANDTSNAAMPLQYQLQNIGGQALLSPVNVPLHNFASSGAGGSLIATQNGMVVRMNSPQQISNLVFRPNEHSNGVRQPQLVGMTNGLPMSGVTIPSQCTTSNLKGKEIADNKVSESANLPKEQKTTFLQQNTTIVHQTTMLTNSGVTASQVSSHQQVQVQSDVLTCSQTIVDHCPSTRNTVSGPQVTASQEIWPNSQISPTSSVPVPVPCNCDNAVTPVSQPCDIQASSEQNEMLDCSLGLSHSHYGNRSCDSFTEPDADQSEDEMIIDVQIESYETDSEDSSLLVTNVIKEMPRFNVGDLVWGQIRGFPSWPGKVVSDDHAREHCPVYSKESLNGRDNCQWVQWFGDYTITLVKSVKLKTLIKGLESYNKVRKKYKKGRKMHSHLETAVQEAISQLDNNLFVSEDDEVLNIISSMCDNTRAGRLRNKRKKLYG